MLGALVRKLISAAQYRQRPVWWVMLTILCAGFGLPAHADANRFDGTVIFIRHALAPGTGDPVSFDLGDCRTQRNLDATGREQARAIGRTLAASGLAFGAIYSSQWCRCLETAQLLGLGPVTPFSGLNSFYEDHAPRGPTLAKLAAKLDSLPRQGKPVVMVTHFVTIAAITGIAATSGGMVLYDLASGSARQLSPAAFAASSH
jgi:phosphohistidine phosphatase SixA